MSEDADETVEAPTENTRPWLKPWQPGQSGNPKGRPKKGMTMMDLLEQRVGKRKLQIVNGLIKQAERGNVRAFVAIADRLYGVPKSALEHSAPDSPYHELLQALTGGVALGAMLQAQNDSANPPAQNVHDSATGTPTSPAAPQNALAGAYRELPAPAEDAESDA